MHPARTRRAVRSVPYSDLRGLSKESRRRSGRTTFLSYCRRSSDGPVVEAANPRASVGGGSPGTPGGVPSRMGPASTEVRGRAPARRGQRTRIKLVCGEPARLARGTGPHDGKHIDAVFRTFETAHARRTETHPRFRSTRRFPFREG